VTIRQVTLPTRIIDPALQALLGALKVGQRIKITHAVRVGDRTWSAVREGTFRDLNYLATGLSTDRVPADDIVVPTIHFTKDGGELSSMSLDENTKVELMT